MKPACRIEMFGGMRLQRSGQALPRLTTRKTEVLLAYLAFYPRRAHSREVLAEMLWPDEESTTVRNRFKQALSSLRRALESGNDSPVGILIANRQDVQLDSEAFTTDVAEFEGHLLAGAQEGDPAERACRIERAIALYRGELLPGYYEEWIGQERERLSEAFRSALSRLVSLRAKMGDRDGAIEAARRAVQADPLREASYYDLIRLYVATGRPAEALRLYRQLERTLRDQLGATPLPAIQALAAQLQARVSAGSGVSTTPRPESAPPDRLADPERASIPNNLPQPLTSFIGRQQEIEAIQSLLAKTSLLTLAGTGGCGKTRLALRIGADLLDAYPDGVWLVELAPLSDPSLVPQAVAAALGVNEEPGRPISLTLRDTLQPRRALLLLDNCEHLLAPCAALAETLLQNCPDLQMLTTSREPLRIGGEVVYRVPSLFAPDPARLPQEEKELAAIVSEFDSVRLFMERARFQRPDLVLNRDNAPVITSICYRLDGIPLAIELAAARVRALSIEQIHVRLDDCFRLLSSGSRTALPRQQTLKAALDWSYELLTEPERLLLARLAVFAGGWTLEAAEEITGESEDVLSLLADLVDKSLVAYETEYGQPRYRLLETIRQYSLEKLKESGQWEQLCARHRDYFLAYAERAEPSLYGERQKEWLDRLEREHDNLRAALTFCRQTRSQAQAGLRLAGALAEFWDIRGHYSEGREHLQAVLAAEADYLQTPEMAKALYGAGSLAWRQCDFAAARALFEQSLALRRELGDRQGISSVLNSLGNVAIDQGDYPAAHSLYTESLEIKKDLGDRQGIAASFNNLAIVAYQQGDYARARALHEQSLQIKRKRGDRWGIAISLGNLGEIAEKLGDFVHARALLEESLAMRRELGDRWGIALALSNLGTLAHRQGDIAQVGALHEESLAIRRQLGDKVGMGASLIYLGNLARQQGDFARARALLDESIEIIRQVEARQGVADLLKAFADLAQAQGQFERAVRLWAAMETLRGAMNSPLPPQEKTEHEQRKEAVRSVLGEKAFAAAWVSSQAMSIEQAIEYAGEEF